MNEIAKKIVNISNLEYLEALALTEDIIDLGGNKEDLNTMINNKDMQGIETYRAKLMFCGGV